MTYRDSVFGEEWPDEYAEGACTICGRSRIDCYAELGETLTKVEEGK